MFSGGSAYSMAQSIADGYIIATELTFKKFGPPDFKAFLFETDKLLREIRSAQTATDDVQATQTRQRRMQRLQQAVTIAHNVRSRRY